MRARLLALILALVPLAAGAQVPPGRGGPKEVGVVVLQEALVPFSVTLPGRAVASAQTQIRPRVGGMVEAITYTPGSTVAVGDPLFRLEAASFEAALAAAEAERIGAQASLDAARATVERYTRLEGTGVTTSDLQTAQAALAQAEAALKGAEAALQTAQLDLDRVEIRSPIAGIVDVAQVSVGAIVTANQADALTTVTAMDPIWVDVAESSARMLRVRARIDSGAMQVGERLDAVLTLENGETYADIGELVSPGFQVSPTTGSIALRFGFDNPDRLIIPGQFLRVEIAVGQQRAILVPQRAAQRQADGSLTAFVARDGVADQVTLTYTGTYDNAWIVTEGVVAGDEVILDGLTNLTAGAAITTVPVTINPQGVVEDAADHPAPDPSAQPAAPDQAATPTEGR